MELNYYDKENLKDLKEYYGYDGDIENIKLPWVVTGKLGSKIVIEFSSDSEGEAMSYILQEAIRRSYSVWEGITSKEFCINPNLIAQVITDYLLSPQAKEAISNL